MNNFSSLTVAEKALVKPIVHRYQTDKSLVRTMLSAFIVHINESPMLMPHIHSIRSRLKDEKHLQDKIARKIIKARTSEPFTITADNLFESINDLAGVRILHLHRRQIVLIDKALKQIFHEQQYAIEEDATARTWDDEYREFYQSIGVATTKSDKMYTSVHYVIASNSATKVTCEIQVRTLAEELWGEVDHSMNYPMETKVESCREQIRVLARFTSGCSRLVDSIYASSSKK